MKDTLVEQGFTPYEAEIYLCLLQNGRLSAYEVAEKTGLYRQACYDALNRLREKGFATTLKQGRTRLFKATEPDAVLGQLRADLLDFEEILPQLMTLKKESKDPVEVEVFSGAKVLLIAFEDIIKTLKEQGGENCCTSVDEHHQQLVEPRNVAIIQQYQRFMLENGFKERVIVKEGVETRYPTAMTTYRSVSEKYFNQNPIQVYGNHVQILLGGTPNTMILIKSQGIADSFRKQFELMWSAAKPAGKVARKTTSPHDKRK